jgi:hypothetical protein
VFAATDEDGSAFAGVMFDGTVFAAEIESV